MPSEPLVQGAAVAVAEVGDDEAAVDAVAAGLDAGDDAADPAPGLGGVEEFLEAADLAFARIGLEARRGAFLETGDMPPDRAVGGEAEHVVEAVRLAPVHDVRAGVMAVGTNEDRDLGPMAADRPHQATQKRPDLDALRPLRRAQEGGDEATLGIEDDNRLEAVFVVVGVEQAQLLAAMHRIEGVVDVEDDAPRHLAERAAVVVSDDHAGLKAARRAVLPGAIWQRCQFHLAQNAIHHAPNLAIRKRIGAELRRIWNASSLQTAQEELDRLVAAYRGTADRLADWLEHNVPEGLAVFTLPEPHWRRMRTANPIERAIQQEIKRRTSKVRVFPNRDALLRLATAVLVEIDEDWATSDRIYINWHSPDA